MQCCGIILAGGKNTRMEGNPKGFLKVGGEMLMDRTIKALTGRVAPILIISNEPAEYLKWDLPLFSDIYQKKSSLTGLHTALFHCSESHALIVPCDMPFITGRSVDLLLEQLTSDIDVVVPQTDMGLEPLCAVYSRRCLPNIENRIVRNLLQIKGFYRSVKVKKINAGLFFEGKYGDQCFFNINTPHDLKTAERIEQIARGKGL